MVSKEISSVMKFFFFDNSRIVWLMLVFYIFVVGFSIYELVLFFIKVYGIR